MTNIVLSPVGSLTQNPTTAQTAINNNFTAIGTAFTDALSKSGEIPAQMTSSLDMNSNQILNLPAPLTANSPARLQDLSTLNGGGTVSGLPAGGTTGQFLTKTSNSNFIAGWTSLIPRLANPGTLYVATSGNDSNSGTSLASPFLTIQAAVNTALQKYDSQGSDITISVGQGTFSGFQVNGALLGAGFLNIVGAGSTLTTINSTIVANAGANIRLGSMFITVASGSNILSEYSSTVTLANSDLNLGAAQVALVDVYNNSSFNGQSGFGFKISGGAQYGFLISSGSKVILSVGATVTITGTPNFSVAFIDAIDNSMFDPGSSSTWTGTATGLSYTLGTNSTLDMENLATTVLPGTGFGSANNFSSVFATNFNSSNNTTHGGVSTAGNAITTGTNNTAIGAGALNAVTTASNSTAVGSNALITSTVQNDAFGSHAGSHITTSPANVAIGYFSLGGNSSTSLTGSGSNTAVGFQALSNANGTANTNTAIGTNALFTSTTASSNTAIGYNSGNATTGGSNTFIGTNAGAAVTTGASNVAIGVGAMNTAVTGSSNVVIGGSAALQAVGDSNEVVIGASATGFGSNSLNLAGVIGITGTNVPATSVGSTAGSFSAGGKLSSNSPSGGVGYSAGAGGTVTQATSRTTGVTLNKTTGAITLFSAAGVATATTFTVTNSSVAAADVVIVNQASGTNLYEIFVTAVTAGTFNITFLTTGGTATDAPVFNFAVIKGSTT